MKKYLRINTTHLPTYYRRCNSLVLALLTCLLAFCLSACGGQTITMHASWAEYYTTLKDLKLHSDFAVSGQITQIGSGVKPGDGPVYSDVTLTVKQVLWNAHEQKAVPPTIEFHENGGTYNNNKYVVDDDPLYAVGQHVVLFFTEYSPGKYRVTGGPTGRFLVENNQVKPIAADGVRLSQGTDVSSFTSNLQTSN